MAIFEKRVVDTTMAAAHFVLPADFDADGDLDLLATSEATGTVAWFEHDGQFNFVKRTIDADLAAAYPASVTDLDADGDFDVLAGGYKADRYVWYRNDGLGGFSPIDIDRRNGPHSIVADDVDRDGDLDLITATQKANSISWYENVGGPAFSEHTIDSASIKAKSALPVDIDGDGDTDIVSASYGDDIVSCIATMVSRTSRSRSSMVPPMEHIMRWRPTSMATATRTSSSPAV